MPFSNNGIVITDISNNSNDHATGVAIDASGNIVVVGFTNAIDATRSDFAVLRYLPTGQLDPSFGPAIPGISPGIVITELSNNSYDQGNCIAIDNSGRIVVAGSTYIPSSNTSNDFAVMRYLPDGVLDTSFGNGGKVVTDISGGNYDFATSVAIDAAGRIVVVGYTIESGPTLPITSVAVVRYLSNGQTDPSFGTGGKVISNLDGYGNDNKGVSVGIDPSSGRILVGCISNLDQGFYDFALICLDTSGNPDLSFGINGTGIVYQSITPGNDFTSSIAIDPSSGNIFVTGYSELNSGQNSIVVLNYKKNGQPEPFFGNGGNVVTNITAGSNDLGTGVAIDGSGNIVVAATTTVFDISHYNFAVLRYLRANGALDSSFGPPIAGISGGIVITDICNKSIDRATKVVIDASGRIVVAGSTRNPAGSTYDIAVIRYLSNGTLDNGAATTTTTTTTTIPPTSTTTTTITTTTTTTTMPPDNIYICFKEGTRILTSNGYVRVETLTPGTLVKTFRHGFVPLRSLGRSRVYNDGGPARLKEKLYVYRRGSLAENGTPFADLVVTGEHSALVGSLGPREKAAMTRHFGFPKITDGQYHLLAQHDARAVPYEQRGVFTVYHFSLVCGSDYERHYGVYANGMLMESCSVNHLKAIIAKE